MFAEVFSQIGRAASGDRTEYLRPFYCFADIILTLRLVLDWLTRFLTTLFEMHRLFSVEWDYNIIANSRYAVIRRFVEDSKLYRHSLGVTEEKKHESLISVPAVQLRFEQGISQIKVQIRTLTSLPASWVMLWLGDFFRPSRLWSFKSRSSELWRRGVMWYDTNVSKVHATFSYTVKITLHCITRRHNPEDIYLKCFD